MKTDARVRYTRMRIKDAFLACLAEKPVSKITVKELCDMAEINRATFYKHYADPFDLLDKLEQEGLEWLEKTIEINEGHQNVLLTLLRHLSDTNNPYSALVSTNGNTDFAGRISVLLYQKFCPQIAQYLPCRTEDEQRAAYLFVVGGCSYLLNEWIKSGKRTTPEEVAAHLKDMTETFIRAYGSTSP